MRRGILLVASLALLGSTLPLGTQAVARSLPGALFGTMTRPIGAVLGTMGRVSRIGRPHHAVARSESRRHAARSRSARHRTVMARPAPAAQRSAALPATTGAAAAISGAAVSAPAPPGASSPTSPPMPGAAAALPSDQFQGRPPRESSQPAPEPMPLGAVGPLTWPTAYEDVIGFALWPKRYGERLRSHGIGDVLGAIFMPTGPWAANARVNGPRSADARSDAAANGPSGCPGQASADWPTSEIERSMSLTSEQRAALDEFRAAIGEAVEAIKITCRDAADLTPVDRIRAMQDALWAVRDAAILIRAPLAKFYDALTDDQKKPFVIADSTPDPRSGLAASRGAGRNEIARMCGMPKPAESPIRQIERELRPTKAQRASFDELQKKTSEMGQFLLASCLQPISATPTARLDAAADRLTAVIFAANHVGLALNDFYHQLSEQQQAKFKASGH
jgi:hypothetical protein